jgi:hypothetical protein
MTPEAPVTARTGELPILRNPFHLLGVSSRDNRQRIVAAAEEKSLSLDGEICAKARGDLTHPRNRLAAELAWLPGIAPGRSGQLIDLLVRHPGGVFAAGDLPALARANLMASAILAQDPRLEEPRWVSCILALGQAFEDISAASVLAAINEDRAAAGFTEVKAVAAVEEGLAERRRDFRDCLRNALDTLPPRKLARVVTAAAETATSAGTVHPPALIDGMVDVFAIGTHAFLTRETGNVRLLIDRVRNSAPSGAAAIEPHLGRLETVVRNWHSVARPIQVLARAKGTSHRPSLDIADAVRGLGLHLGKTCRMLEPARRMVLLTKEAFGHLPEIVERIDEDARVLDDAARRKTQGTAPHPAAAPAGAPGTMTIPSQIAADAKGRGAGPRRPGPVRRTFAVVRRTIAIVIGILMAIGGVMAVIHKVAGPPRPSITSSHPNPVVFPTMPIRPGR